MSSNLLVVLEEREWRRVTPFFSADESDSSLGEFCARSFAFKDSVAVI
jgi:hypothetical protein